MRKIAAGRRRFLIGGLIVGLAALSSFRCISSPSRQAQLTTAEKSLLRLALIAECPQLQEHRRTVSRYLKRYQSVTEISRPRVLQRLHQQDLLRQATLSLGGYLVTPAEWAFLELLLPR